MPPPALGVPIALEGGEVIADFVWRDARLIVEADGHRYDPRAAR